jgi:hypothetical protein
VTFNAKERTLREIVALALSAGWKVTKVTRAQGSLFGHILAVPVDIPVQEDDDRGQNQPELAGGCAEAESASVSAPTATAVVAVADADDRTGVREEPGIDTPTFAFASNVDVRSVAADSISTSMSISTTTSAAAAAPAKLGHRSNRGWGIMRKASSPLVGRLRPRPSNMEFNVGVENNSESSGSREGLSENTGGGRDNNINERRGPTLKKKGSLGMTFPDSYRFSKSASLTILLSLAFLSALSFPRSSSLDYCFSHRS